MESNDWIYYTIVPDILLLVIGLVIYITIYVSSNNINKRK